MEHIFTLSVAVTVISALIGGSAIWFIWRVDKLVAVVIAVLAVLIMTAVYVRLPIWLPNFLGMNGWAHKVFSVFYNLEPRLFNSWQEIGAWLGVSMASVAACLSAFYAGLLYKPTQVIDGTRILALGEMRTAARKKGVSKTPIYIGGVPIPESLETRSTGIAGEPGSGKTQIIETMMKSVKSRGDRAVVIDVGSNLYKKLGSPSDSVLSIDNLAWSPFAEIRQESDCEMIARSLIAEGSLANLEWNEYGRVGLSVFMKYCWNNNKRRNSDLAYLIKDAKKSELIKIARGTYIQRLFEPGNEKMLGSVQSIMSTALSSFSELAPNADHQSFSIRSWVENESDKSWLWIPFDDISSQATKSLRTAWVNILINSSITLRPDSGRRLWFAIDELASLGKIDLLDTALSRGRKYGLSLIWAVQNISQLRVIYGRDEADSLMGSSGHKVLLRTPDPETADILSRMIGENEIEKVHETHSSNGGSSQTINEIKRAVMASNLARLPDLKGYLKISGMDWSPIKVPLSGLVDIAAKKHPDEAFSEESFEIAAAKIDVSTLDEV